MRNLAKIIALCALMALATTFVGAATRPVQIATEEQAEIIAELIQSGGVNVAVADKIYHSKIETSGSVSGWTKRMKAAHEIADAARGIGVTEDDPIITRLQAIWREDRNDLQMIAKTISGEAPYCPFDHQVAVGAVVLNRVNDPRFPDTVYGVLTQTNPMQYSFSYVYGFDGISEQCYKAAIAAMNGDHDVPANVVWQAEFFQGRGIWKASPVWTPYYSSVTYFCY